MKNTLYTLWGRVRSWIKKPWVIGLIVLLVIILAVSLRGGNAAATEEVVEVKSGTITEEVSVTGKVRSAKAVDLAMERTGKVTSVRKEVGDTVKVGETIFRIDSSDLAADLAQAQASVRYQLAKLRELEAGTQVDSANARETLISAIQSAYTTADDSVRNKVDDLFIDPNSSYPRLKFSASSPTNSTVESGRVEVGARLRSMQSLLTSLQTSTDLTSTSDRVKRDLGEIKLFLDNTAVAVNALTTDSNPHLTKTEIDAWKTDLSTARSSVNSTITTLLTADEKYRSNVSVTSGGTRTGATDEQIEAQRAQVASAQATVAGINADIAKTYIKSPIDGVVTVQEAKVGEIVSVNTKVASVMSNAQFEIEAFVPESDLTKVKAGSTAVVTLDAYGSDTEFNANVVSVDPAETLIEGVPTYKTIFQFEKMDERIRSGMTANIDIKGQSKDNVLSIPQRAITTRGGVRFVKVQRESDVVEEVEIRTGIRGSDGSVEVVSGLSEGDRVIIRIK